MYLLFLLCPPFQTLFYLTSIPTPAALLLKSLALPLDGPALLGALGETRRAIAGEWPCTQLGKQLGEQLCMQLCEQLRKRHPSPCCFPYR